MYYLRSEQSGHSDITFDEKCDRAVFKHYEKNQFCRAEFKDLKTHPTRFILYTCKSIRQILYMRDLCFEHWNEWFDVYDEQGKIDLNNLPENREQTITLPCHIGDTLYYTPEKHPDCEPDIYEYEVVGGSPNVLFVCDKIGNLCTFGRVHIGTCVFFNKAEAEEALQRIKSAGETNETER